MAMRLQVSDEVLAQLGRPTVEGLAARLVEPAPCLQCGKPLGSGPVAVIGQQYENKALIVGAHAACCASEWIRFEEAQKLQVPVTGDLTTVFAYPSGSPWRRRPGWLARLAGRRPMVPVMLVFPFVGVAWVELVGPGESVNDDLAYYRDHLGLCADEDRVPDLADARAWIDEQGRLVAAVKTQQFETLEPLTAEMTALVRWAGVVQLAVVSGVEIHPDGARAGSVGLADLYTAAREGRLVSGTVELASPRSGPRASKSNSGCTPR
jgi:hypothetical protein